MASRSRRGTYAVFQKLGMSSRDYGKDTQKMAGNEQIASEVANNPNGIGYVGLAYINTPGVKVLPVEGIYPVYLQEHKLLLLSHKSQKNLN